MWCSYQKKPDALREYYRRNAKPGRNDPCSCGSQKKYKKCCLNKQSSAPPPKPPAPPSRSTSSGLSQHSIDAYKRFVVTVILGRITSADTIMRQSRSEIYAVANYVQQTDPQPIRRVYRGVLIEPSQVRSGRPLQLEAGEFASFSENRDVACWFALPDSHISEPLAQTRPNAVGWIAEHIPQSDEIIFHHNQTAIVDQLPGLGIAAFARILANNLDPARSAREGADWAGMQVIWNLRSQEEVILKRGIPLRLQRANRCPDTFSLDEHFRYRPGFVLAPAGLTSVGVQSGERLNVTSAAFPDPYGLCPLCGDYGIHQTYYLDRANLLVMQCQLCHQHIFGQRRTNPQHQNARFHYLTLG